MNLTDLLKKWLRDNCEVKEDATDDEYRAACGTALAIGKLKSEEFQKLTETPETKEAGALAKKLDQLTSGIGDLTTLMTEQAKAAAAPVPVDTPADAPVEDKTVPTDDPESDPKPKTKAQPSEVSKMIGRIGGTPADEIDVQVKEAASHYDDTKKSLAFPTHQKSGREHPMAGRPVMDFNERGRPMDEPSDLQRAISGAFAKFLVSTAQRGGSRTFGFQALPQHDRELMHYAMEKMPWGGASDGGDYADINNRKLTPTEQKALIDDATSGGLEAAPMVFDDMVIQTPLLHGELFPLVTVVPLERGRRVEGVSTGTVTSSWGGVDATAITLFNTASYVSAFDTTIFRWEGSIQLGMDFLSDTPIDFGAHITAQYGERLLEDLDDVIATGNGTTQPEGVMNKSGVTSVTWSSATSIGNYESTRFTIAKPEFRANVASSFVFCGTETSYQRCRALPVGASDARRLFGMDHFGASAGGYTFGGASYKINESLTNLQIFAAILARYRMYRRRGLTMRSSTEGDTLIRANELLMVAMARYGGQLERAACAALTSDAPA